MSRKDIKDELEKINPAKFQKLGDRILKFYNPKYENLIPKGTHIYKEQTIKGTPDSYTRFINGDIIAVQYTVAETNLLKKMLDDIKKVNRWELSQYVKTLVFVCNSRSDDTVIKECTEECKKLGWQADFVWLDTLLELIEKKFDAKVVAQDYFNIDCIRITTEADFSNYYKSKYKDLIKQYVQGRYKRKYLSLNIDLFEVSIISSDGCETRYADLIQLSKAIIIGNAGMGKSTAMVKMFLQALEKAEKYVVFVEIDSYNDEALCDLVKKGLEHDNIRVSQDLIERLLQEGKMFLFIDGLDEIPKDKRDRFIAKYINNIKLKTNNFLLSSRKVESINKLVNDFNIFYTQLLNKEIVITVMEKFMDDSINVEAVVAHYYMLKMGKSILSNPLHLSILLKLFSNKTSDAILNIFSKLDSDYEFYNMFFEEIFNWNLVHLENANVEKEDLKECIGCLAYQMIKNYQLRVDRSALNLLIADSLKYIGLENTYQMVVIRELLFKCNFLVEWSKDVYRFEHKKFQEYFAAKFILTRPETLKSEVLKSPVFEEIILLTASSNINFIVDNFDIISEGLSEKIFENFECMPKSANEILKRHIHLWLSEDSYEISEDKLIALLKFYLHDIGVIKIILEYLSGIERNIEGISKLMDTSNIYYTHPKISKLFEVFNRNNYKPSNKDVYRTWLMSTEYGNLACVLSFYTLRLIFACNQPFAVDEEYEQVKRDVEAYYIKVFQGKDYELIYHALKSTEFYFKRELVIGLAIEEYGRVDKLREAIHTIQREVESDVDILLRRIERQSDIAEIDPFKKKLIEIAEGFLENPDDKFAERLIEIHINKRVLHISDLFCEIYGEKIYKKTLLYALENFGFWQDDICNVLKLLNKYDDDITIGAVEEKLFCPSQISFLWEAIREEALSYFCKKPTRRKVMALLNIFNSKTNNEHKLFILMGMWVISKEYSSSLEDDVSKLVDDTIGNYREKNCTFNKIADLVNCSSKLWNVSLYIKDYDISNWSFRFEDFFYEICGKEHSDIVFDICLQMLQKENESTQNLSCEPDEQNEQSRTYIRDMVIWIIENLGNGNEQWLNKLDSVDKALFNSCINQVLESWSEN